MNLQDVLDVAADAATDAGWTVTTEAGEGLDAFAPKLRTRMFTPVLTIARVDEPTAEDFAPASFQVLIAEDVPVSSETALVRRQVLIDSMYDLPTAHELIWLETHDGVVRLSAAAATTQVAATSSVLEVVLARLGVVDGQ